MNKIKKILVINLVILLLLGCIGCKRSATQKPGDAQLVTLTTAAPGEQAPLQPAPTPDSHAGEDFDALDLEIFRWYATDNGSTYHSLVSDPAKFGIDPATVSMTLGEFSEAANKQFAQEAADFLERLHEIQRFALTEEQQLSYDIIEQFLQNCAIDAEYEYYYEPLTEYSGIHAEIPLLFALYEIQNQQDVENYLTLLADVPRYLDQVLTYEKEKAGKGLFMTERALEAVLDGCQDVIDSKENSFLYDTFRNALELVEGLNAEQKNAYIARNDDLVRNGFMTAYETFYDGLKSLRSKCRDSEGMYVLGEQATNYFEQRLRSEADNQLSVEETLDLIKGEIDYQTNMIAEIAANNQDVLNTQEQITSGDAQKDLDTLIEMTKSLLPELPEHELSLKTVPEELQDVLSPAFYVIPSLDDWKNNEVWINPGSPSSTLFLTVAHEAYPGHMYQYVYQRGNENLGVCQRAFHYSGYAEGWSQLAEYLTTENQKLYQQDYCKIRFYDSMLGNALIPAAVSILVNYYSYSRDSINTYLSAKGINNEQLVDYYYNLAIDQPFYTICYAVGYSQLMSLMRDAQTDLGDSFDQKAFLTAYLDLGPGYFNLIQERMDVWVDEQMMEEAA